MRSLQKHSNMFSELPITETCLFGPKHTGEAVENGYRQGDLGNRGVGCGVVVCCS